MTCIPHKSNAPGDFYVEDGCCTSCGMPQTEAADLFENDLDGHCFVSKQPTAIDEVNRMISAFEVQEVGCIRYRGANKQIQIRLVEVGEGEQCDQLLPELKERNAFIQAERAARFAAWKAKQASVENVKRQEVDEIPSFIRRIFSWLGIHS
jgi:hypothetical protein